MFKQDETTGLPRKLTQKEKVTGQANQNSPSKRKTKATGKRTGGRPTQKLQTSGMRLQLISTPELRKRTPAFNRNQHPASSNSDNDDQSSISSEDIAPSPKSNIKNEHHPRFQRYHSGSQRGTANRRCPPRLVTPYQLTSSIIKTMKKRRLYNLNSIRHRRNRTQTITRA